MSQESAVQPDLSADETRELARLVAAMVGVMLLFGLFLRPLGRPRAPISSDPRAVVAVAALG